MNTSVTNAHSPVITNVAQDKLSQEVAYQTLLQGILQQLQNVTSFFVQGKEMTRDELVSALQGVIAAAETTKAKKNEWHAAVQAERQVLAVATPLRESIRALIISRHGKTSPILREFGFTPAKVRTTPVASKITALAKSTSTRKARGTMGKTEKLLSQRWKPIELRIVA